MALLLLSQSTYIHFGPAVHAWVCLGSLTVLEFDYKIHVHFSPEKAFRVHHISQWAALISWRIFCFLPRDFLLGFPDRSVGIKCACNAGDPGLIPELGRSVGKGIGYPLQYSWASFVTQLVKKSACNVGHRGSIPGLGRAPGEGKGYLLQYSGLENSMDYSPWGHRVGHVWVTFTFTPETFFVDSDTFIIL